jgi:hypothetical protein
MERHSTCSRARAWSVRSRDSSNCSVTRGENRFWRRCGTKGLVGGKERGDGGRLTFEVFFIVVAVDTQIWYRRFERVCQDLPVVAVSHRQPPYSCLTFELRCHPKLTFSTLPLTSFFKASSATPDESNRDSMIDRACEKTLDRARVQSSSRSMMMRVGSFSPDMVRWFGSCFRPEVLMSG